MKFQFLSIDCDVFEANSFVGHAHTELGAPVFLPGFFGVSLIKFKLNIVAFMRFPFRIVDGHAHDIPTPLLKIF